MVHAIALATLLVLAQAGAQVDKPVVETPKQEAEIQEPEAARRLLQNGRYAEADEAYAAAEDEAKKQPGGLTPSLKAAIALGKVECQSSQGETGKAIAILEQIVAEQPKNADVSARLAELHWGRGDWEAADALAKQALAVNPDHLSARWVAARLLE